MSNCREQVAFESPKLNIRLEEMRTCTSNTVNTIYSSGNACNACGLTMTSDCISPVANETIGAGSLSRQPLLPLSSSLSFSIEEETQDDVLTENDVFLNEQQNALMSSTCSAIRIGSTNAALDQELSDNTLGNLPPTYSELSASQQQQQAHCSNRLLSITSAGETVALTSTLPVSPKVHSKMLGPNRFQYLQHHHFQHHSNLSGQTVSNGCTGAISATTSSTTTSAAVLMSESGARNTAAVELCGSVISVQPHRKCGDASTSGPSQAAVRKLTRTRSNLDAFNGLVFVLSAVYAKLIVILGLCFPMAEVISHRIPIGWYEGFYLYLYLGKLHYHLERLLFGSK